MFSNSECLQCVCKNRLISFFALFCVSSALAEIAPANEIKADKAKIPSIFKNLEKQFLKISSDLEAKDKKPIPVLSEAVAKDKKLAPAPSVGSAKDKKPVPALSEASAKDKKPVPALSEASAKDKKPVPALSEVSAKDKKLAPAPSVGSAQDKKPAPAPSVGSAQDKKSASALSEASAKDKKLAPALSEASAKDKKLAPALSEASAQDKKPALSQKEPLKDVFSLEKSKLLRDSPSSSAPKAWPFKTFFEQTLINIDYSFYAATSLLRRVNRGQTHFFGENFALGISRKNWTNKEIYINFRAFSSSDRRNFIHLEFIPRLFYSLSFLKLRFYAGAGMGFGLFPNHIFFINRDIDRILSLNFQLFTGMKWPNLYKNFGLVGELSWTGLILPFFVFSGEGHSRKEVSGRGRMNQSISRNRAGLAISRLSDPNNGAFITDTSLNIGILYNF